jgi:hypothetical protein
MCEFRGGDRQFRMFIGSAFGGLYRVPPERDQRPASAGRAAPGNRAPSPTA